MDHLPLTHSLRHSRPSGMVEALLIVTAVATAAATVEEPLVAPLIVAGAVFALAAARFKPLLLFVVFFLPVSPILQWALPIHDLGTLIRLAMFLGVFAARIIDREPLWKWLLSGK